MADEQKKDKPNYERLGKVLSAFNEFQYLVGFGECRLTNGQKMGSWVFRWRYENSVYSFVVSEAELDQMGIPEQIVVGHTMEIRTKFGLRGDFGPVPGWNRYFFPIDTSSPKS